MKKTARDQCRAIRDLMKPTDRLRPKDAALVMIPVDLWRRIYRAALEGMKV